MWFDLGFPEPLHICSSKYFWTFYFQEEESTPDKMKKLEESQAKGKAESSAGNNNEKRNNFQQMAEDELLKLRQALKERQKASMVKKKIKFFNLAIVSPFRKTRANSLIAFESWDSFHFLMIK